MPSAPPPNPDDEAPADAARRELMLQLKRLGYALPVVTALLATKDAHALLSLDPSCAPDDCPD